MGSHSKCTAGQVSKFDWWKRLLEIDRWKWLAYSSSAGTATGLVTYLETSSAVWAGALGFGLPGICLYLMFPRVGNLITGIAALCSVAGFLGDHDSPVVPATPPQSPPSVAQPMQPQLPPPVAQPTRPRRPRPDRPRVEPVDCSHKSHRSQPTPRYMPAANSNLPSPTRVVTVAPTSRT
jgi:hypothetical protein